MLGEYQYHIISKLEAADRQLRVAIRLFFERKDLLAVHTLAAAAQGILVDLARPRDIKIIFDRLDPDLRRAFRAPQNFLKHADKDPEQQFAFFLKPPNSISLKRGVSFNSYADNVAGGNRLSRLVSENVSSLV